MCDFPEEGFEAHYAKKIKFLVHVVFLWSRKLEINSSYSQMNWMFELWISFRLVACDLNLSDSVE